MEQKQQQTVIELDVKSGRGLRSFNFFQKLLLYANVSITASSASDEKTTSDFVPCQRTPTDTQGDGNPDWNHHIRFDLPDDGGGGHHLFLKFELRHDGFMFGNKTIGEVLVPLGDLIRESSGALRSVTYEVRTFDGKPNGVLNFSFKAMNQKAVDDALLQTETIPYSLHPDQTGFPFSTPSEQIELTGSPKIRYPDICQPEQLVHVDASPWISSPAPVVHHYFRYPEIYPPPSAASYYHSPSPGWPYGVGDREWYGHPPPAMHSFSWGAHAHHPETWSNGSQASSSSWNGR